MWCWKPYYLIKEENKVKDIQSRKEEMKPYLFSSHTISYAETFQGVYKVKPKYQNDEVSKDTSQSTNTNINITLYSINKHTETKIKNTRTWRGWLTG